MRVFLNLILSVFALALFFPGGATANDDSLRLRFREGQTIKYQYQEVMSYTPPSKFAGASNQLALSVIIDYTFKVTGVNANKSAIVKLTFDNIVVEKEGVQIAEIPSHQIPKQGQNITATVNINGEVTFYKFVYLTINPSGVLEYRIVKGGNALASKSLSGEGEKELFAADLDPYSGMIRVGVPPTRDVNDPERALLAEIKVDLTPRKVYELLLLPTAPLDDEKEFVVPKRYLANVVVTNAGRTDVQGRRTDKVHVEVNPWDEPLQTPSGPGSYEPELTGSFDYFIDPELGRMVKAEGNLDTRILIPNIGEQIAHTRIKLEQRR